MTAVLRVLASPPMRIVLTLLVRDEIDVIAANLEYHLGQRMHHIIVTDNGSRDGTRELLGEYQRRGAITLIDEPPADFSQHVWVTRMARMAHELHAADWVINGDADELFLWTAGTLHEAFARVPADVRSLLAVRHDFVPFERPYVRAPQLEMIYRKALSLNTAGRPLPPKTIHRGASDVVISQGNHHARSAAFDGPPVLGEIEVMHYPIRSLAQFESKARNGGSGYAVNRELPPETGFHKRRWYRKLLLGELAREYHEKRYFSPSRLESALRSGELIEDRRAADRVTALRAFSADRVATGR
jgi:hypothetical protein